MKPSDAFRLLRPALWEFLHTRDRRAEVQAIAARVAELEGQVAESRDRAEDRWRLLSSRMHAHRPYRIVILVHNVAAWSSIEALHAAMLEADDFDPIVISIPRCFGGGPEFSEEDVNHAGLLDLGVDHVRFDMPDPADGLRLLEFLKPDVILRQSQWDQDVPPAYSAASLGFARLALVPYEIVNIVRNVESETANDTAVDEPLHRAAWRVYCANADALAQAERGARLGASAWRALGHPKVDAILATRAHWPIAEPAPGRRVVLSFHHTVTTGWTNFGVFADVADELVAWAATAPDDQFVVSPHPALEHTVKRTEEGRALWARFELDWSALPNTAIRDPHSPYLPLLAAADVIVTDGLSALLEGQLLAKPVVWWERADHAPLNPVGLDVVSTLPVVTSTREAREAAETLGRTPELDSRRDHLVTRFGGGGDGAATAILNDMRGGLA